MNTSGGGTTREHQQHQQQTRGNQAVVGSGDTVVPTTQFSSKQSKTSTVTITGELILYHRPCSFFELRSLSLSFFNLSFIVKRRDEDECADFFPLCLLL
jgi:hypothetical protein